MIELIHSTISKSLNENDPWRQLANGATTRFYHSAVSMNGKMYIFGGFGTNSQGVDGQSLNDLWEYDPVNDSWRQVASGATTRYYHSAVSMNGKMYVFGGIGTNSEGVINQRLNDLWEYDPSNGSWKQLTSGATARQYHTTASVNGKMYIFGGFDRSYLGDLWEYDPDNDSWRELDGGPSPRRYHSAVSIDNKMYIFGGEDDEHYLGDLWEYDPSNSSWRYLGDWTGTRAGHSTVSIDNKMYVFGGVGSNSLESDEMLLNELWEYNLSNDSWRQLSTGPSVRYGQTAVSMNDKIYIFGGNDGYVNLNDLWEYTP